MCSTFLNSAAEVLQLIWIEGLAWLGLALFLVKPKILMGSHQCKLYCMNLRGVFDDVLGLVKPKKIDGEPAWRHCQTHRGGLGP